VIIQIPKKIHAVINPSNAELNTICHFLALLGVQHILHVSRIRVNCAAAKAAKSNVAMAYGTADPIRLPSW